MNTENLAVETIFNAAKALPPESRTEYLNLACRDDAVLRREVERLLAAATGAENFFEAKPVGLTQLGNTVMDTTVREGPGTRIGRYKLLQQIGEGGMGVVYMAEQEDPVRRRVALKIIKLGMDTRQVVARFEAERQALAMMDHPNIARVLDGGTTESGRPYFVMELVQGVSIIEFCDKARLSAKERLDLFLQVCEAVQSAHQKGIIHRDLKPSNILVTQHQGKPMPKVIDFGIAKATNQKLTEKTLFTQHATMIGTPAYMSPEQAELSSMDVDTRSDIYSLGVLLYELLTGSTPFPEKRLRSLGYGEMQRVIAEEEPERPSARLSTLGREQKTMLARNRGEELATLHSRLRGDLDWIVMKCLEKDRARRYETANGLAADLKRHLDNEPVVARPPSTAYRMQKAWQRNKLTYTAAVAVAFTLVLGISLSSWQAFKALRAQREAEAARRGEAVQRQEAQKKQSEAESERGRADTQARNAVASQEHSRRLLYAADMNLAQQAVNQNNLGRARRLLERHRPGSGEEDLRGWEWRYLWQQCRSDALAHLTKRPARGFSVSFSPDGSQLAAGYFDGRIELWNVAHRTLLSTLNTSNHLAHVAFSPRSNVLAATSDWGVLKLHDFASGRETVVWRGENAIRDISFSSDGSRLLAFTYGQAGPSAVTIDLTQGVASGTNTTSGANLHTGIARLSRDGKRLFLSRKDGNTQQLKVNCLDPATGRDLWAAGLGTDYGVTAMALSPDEKVLVTATGFAAETIRVWDAETGRPLAALQGHTAWVGEVVFSQDGRWLASAAADQTIRLWDTARWTEARILRGHEDEVHTVAFSPDGRQLASGGKDGRILLWDVAAPQSTYGHRLLPPDVGGVAEYAPGLAIATDPRGRKPAMIRLADLSESRVSVGSDLSVPFTYLPPNHFGYYEQTNVLRIMEYGETGSEVFRETVGPNLHCRLGVPIAFLAHSREQKLIAWSETTGRVHVAGMDSSARHWEWRSEFLRPIPLTFSPDGQFLVLAGSTTPPELGPDGQPLVVPGARKLEVRDVRTGKLVLQSDIALNTPGDIPAHRPPVLFADAGRKLVVAKRKGDNLEVLFWDLKRPDHPPVRFEERGTLSGLSVSPDGRWVAVGSYAGLLVLYEATTSERRRVLHGMLQAVFSVAFSPDSRSLASGGGGRESIKLWQVETGQELLTLPGPGSLLGDLAFTEGGNALLLGRFGQSGSWQQWRAPSWKVIHAAEAKDSLSAGVDGQGKAERQRP